MRIFGNCGECGRPIEESKKTCGANYIICNKCKRMLHIHCSGEHKLRHKTIQNQIKNSLKNQDRNAIKFFTPLKRILSKQKRKKENQPEKMH